jgi:hypothetical protein
MKKFLFLIVISLFMVFAFIIAGCTKSSPTTATTATMTPDAAQQTQTAEAQLPTSTPTMTPNMTATEGAVETKTAVAIQPTLTQTYIARVNETATANANASATATAQAQETSIAVAQETATAQAQQNATYAAQQTQTEQATETAVAQLTGTAVANQPAATQTAVARANATATAQANATATAIANSLGTVSGTVTLPGTKPGETYQVILIKNITDVASGSSNIQVSGILTTNTTIPFTITNVPAGSYFLIAATMSSNGAPTFGDYVGVCGTVYPSFPSSANVVITGGNTTTDNITAAAVSKAISGTITLPSPVVTAPVNFQVMIYTSQQSFTDGSQMFSDGGTLGGTGGQITSQSATYTIPLLLPGTYYLEAWVDMNGGSNIMAGDYVYSTTITIGNPISDMAGDITLTGSNVQP